MRPYHSTVFALTTLGAGETSLARQHTSTLVSQLVAAHAYAGQVLWFAAVLVRPGRDKNRGLLLAHDHVVFSQDLEHRLTFVMYHARRLSCSMEVQVKVPTVQHSCCSVPHTLCIRRRGGLAPRN